MRNVIFTSVTAIALGLAPAAQAQSTDQGERLLGGLLFGAVALMALGKALENDKQATTVTAKPKPKPTTQTIPTTRPKPKDRSWKVLPSQCFDRLRTREGRKGIFGGRCLRQNYDSFYRLPQQCRTRIETRHGHPRRGYSVNCLRAKEFRMSSN